MSNRVKTTWAVWASVLAHLVIFGALLLSLPRFKAPSFEHVVDTKITLEGPQFDPPPMIVDRAMPLPLLPGEPVVPPKVRTPMSMVPTLPGIQGAQHAQGTGLANHVAPMPVPRLLHRPAVPGQAIVYLLDGSGSMGEQGRFEFAVQHLLDTLRQTPFGVRYQVIVYQRNPEVLRLDGGSQLVEANEMRVAEAEQQLGQHIAEGIGGHGEALRAALALEPQAIFWLTDAADLEPALARQMTQWNSGRASLHVVRFTTSQSARSRALATWQALTLANRGTTREVYVPLMP